MLTLFIGQTLQCSLEESISSIALSLTQQEGPVALPHGFLLPEALHHVLIQVLCFLHAHTHFQVSLPSTNCQKAFKFKHQVLTLILLDLV